MKLVDREAVIDKLVYTATNPVQDHLVDQVRHWPGINGLTALLTGRPLRATRPLHFVGAATSEVLVARGHERSFAIGL